MAESKQETIDRLLREGLNHYGTGNVAEAVRCWQDVLVLDPAQADARDYIQTAGAADSADDGTIELTERVDGDAAEAPEDSLDVLSQEAMRHLRDGRLEEALDLFETVLERDPARTEMQNYFELLRSQLLKGYRERLGDSDRKLRLRIDGGEVMKFDLPATAGFVLSLVDGTTSVNDVASLSGLDAFETLRILSGLLDSGIVEIEP